MKIYGLELVWDGLELLAGKLSWPSGRLHTRVGQFHTFFSNFNKSQMLAVPLDINMGNPKYFRFGFKNQ